MLPFCCLPGNESDKLRGFRSRAPLSSPDGVSRETEKTMAKNTHLNLSDRITIEVGLREQKSFSAIAAELGKDPTTISAVSPEQNLQRFPGIYSSQSGCSHRGN